MDEPFQFSLGRLMAVVALFGVAMLLFKLPGMLEVGYLLGAILWIAGGAVGGLGIGILCRAPWFFAMEGTIAGVLAALVLAWHLSWRH
jgi:hypothetical protein